ncbi:Fic family protein [Rhizobium sp. MHM7A]|uniref:Fic family protein n=1 Tax=Rhizobium sp. MHM7A TaxID=2583233 RepID=UPI001105BD53|nr:Fic family protein [Rhizobium sp. MHM7A]TLX16084.1 hypothetical protein FFR93_01820 [Rhizobium sp. MHM7A]
MTRPLDEIRLLPSMKFMVNGSTLNLMPVDGCHHRTPIIPIIGQTDNVKQNRVEYNLSIDFYKLNWMFDLFIQSCDCASDRRLTMHPIIALRQLDNLQRQIVNILLRAPEGMPQKAIMSKLPAGVSQPTLSRAMSKLADNDIILKTGETKGALFSLSEDARWFARSEKQRPKVPYDSDRITSYIPNESRWLPQAQHDRMQHAARGINEALDASTYSREIAQRFLIDLAWASSNLEGNTYSYLDTEVLVNYGEQASGHDLYEATMILNHKNAINELIDNVGKPVLNERFASRFHALLLRDLVSDEDLGRVRGSGVGIGGSSYLPSEDRYTLMSGLGSLLWKAEQVEDAFEASFLLLSGLSYLQAFVDGNKRMGRLMCNAPLLWQGLPPISFIGVDQSAYISGLILFYEKGDTSLLAEAVADGYVEHAMSYAAAVATKRVPRSIELKERPRIDRLVRQVIDEQIEGDDIRQLLRSQLADLNEDDRIFLCERVENILNSITADNAAAWGVDADSVERYQNSGPKIGI